MALNVDYIAWIITVLGAINSNLTFIFDLNYFLWKLKTLKRQGVGSLLETKHKVIPFKTKPIPRMSVRDSKLLNLQSHWRPTCHNFGAPKNMGGLCFQVLGSLGALGVFVFKTPIVRIMETRSTLVVERLTLIE